MADNTQPQTPEDGPPLETKPIAVSQQKVRTTLKDYVSMLARQAPFTQDFKVGYTRVVAELSRFWPKLPGWSAQASELWEYIDQVVQSIPDVKKSSAILMRVSVGANLSPPALPEPKEAAVVATVDSEEGVMRRYLVPAFDTPPVLNDMTVDAGVMVVCQLAMPFFNPYYDNRLIGLGSGGNMYGERNRDRIVINSGNEVDPDAWLLPAVSADQHNQPVHDDGEENLVGGGEEKPAGTAAEAVVAGEIAGHAEDEAREAQKQEREARAEQAEEVVEQRLESALQDERRLAARESVEMAELAQETTAAEAEITEVEAEAGALLAGVPTRPEMNVAHELAQEEGSSATGEAYEKTMEITTGRSGQMNEVLAEQAAVESEFGGVGASELQESPAHAQIANEEVMIAALGERNREGAIAIEQEAAAAEQMGAQETALEETTLNEQGGAVEAPEGEVLASGEQMDEETPSEGTGAGESTGEMPNLEEAVGEPLGEVMPVNGPSAELQDEIERYNSTPEPDPTQEMQEQKDNIEKQLGDAESPTSNQEVHFTAPIPHYHNAGASGAGPASGAQTDHSQALHHQQQVNNPQPRATEWRAQTRRLKLQAANTRLRRQHELAAKTQPVPAGETLTLEQ